MGNEARTLILAERTGRWAVGLRRELADAAVSVSVYETRSLAQCWEVLAESPAAFVVVELTLANVDGLLRRMARLETDFPRARVTVVADRALSGHERLLREAGAVHFTCSPRRLGPLARIAVRHIEQLPLPPQSMTERIWASLPWKKG